MRKITQLTYLIMLFVLFINTSINAQHTFSIVAVDPTTGEIGSAAATCLNSEDGARDVSAIVLGTGAINTQSYWDPTNQANATTRMEAGDTPQEILTWLQNNDVWGPAWVPQRQYGIVTLNGGSPLSAAFTGDENWDEKGHRVGPNYAIQGNILISQDVLNDMETAFLNTPGPLCDKLMAVMQAAKRPGADSRCLSDGVSSGSAYIRVAQPTDTDASYGNLWLDINVWLDSGTFTGDPIDELQTQFDDFKENLSVDSFDITETKLVPNPTNGITELSLSNTDRTAINALDVYDILGKKVMHITNSSFDNTITLDLKDYNNGLYIIKLLNDNQTIKTLKLVKR